MGSPTELFVIVVVDRYIAVLDHLFPGVVVVALIELGFNVWPFHVPACFFFGKMLGISYILRASLLWQRKKPSFLQRFNSWKYF